MREYIVPEFKKIVVESEDIMAVSNAGIGTGGIPNGGTVGTMSMDDSTIWSDN